MEDINMINKDKILSPLKEYTFKNTANRRSFIDIFFGKHSNKDKVYYGFERIPINYYDNPYYVRIFENVESNNEWLNTLDTRFIKYHKNENDAMKYVDKILIKKGYDLIDDLNKF